MDLEPQGPEVLFFIEPTRPDWVEIWGLRGRSFDVIVVSAPDGSRRSLQGSPGAAWHIAPMFFLAVGEHVRWTMLDDGDDTMHIDIESSLDDVERFLHMGERLIDGIEFATSNRRPRPRSGHY